MWTFPVATKTNSSSNITNFGSVKFLEAVNTLQTMEWIDAQTRLVVFESAFYSSGLRRWLQVTLELEVMAGGAILPGYGNFLMGEVTEQDMMAFSNGDPLEEDTVWAMAIYGLIVFWVAYYTAAALRQAYLKGRGWVRKPFIWFDLAMVTLLISAVGLRIAAIAVLPMKTGPTGAADSEAAACYTDQRQESAKLMESSTEMFGISLLFVYARFLRYLTVLVPGIDIISKAMVEATWDIFIFGCTFAAVFVGWALCFNVIFSGDVYGFNNLPETMLSLWNSLLGDIDKDAFLTTHETVGPLLYVVFSFTLLFLLLTFIIAIVDSAFDAAKGRECLQQAVTWAESSTDGFSITAALKFIAHRNHQQKHQRREESVSRSSSLIQPLAGKHHHRDTAMEAWPSALPSMTGQQFECSNPLFRPPPMQQTYSLRTPDGRHLQVTWVVTEQAPPPGSGGATTAEVISGNSPMRLLARLSDDCAGLFSHTVPSPSALATSSA